MQNENISYRNNPNLKAPYVEMSYTKEQLIEYAKCKNDVVYFIKNYVRIVNLDKGLINFAMYPFQEKMAHTICDNRFSVIKTCRQAGKTTTSAAVILWHILFKDEYHVAILANKLATAREILSRVQKAYESLPKWLQQGLITWNKTSMELENGSTAIAASTGSSAIRGLSISFLYLDEFAFVPRGIQEEFFTSVYPTIISGSNTKVVITSTPNGFDLFYKIWTNSIEGRNDYQSFSVDWWDVPGRDEEWKRKTISNTSEEQFRQEFDAEFLGSANTLLSPNTLKRLTFISPIHTRYDGCLRVYNEPKEGHNYFCVVDTSRGVGIDASAFIVFDVTNFPYEVSAIYQSNLVDPLFYPDIISEVGRAYGECPVLVEINDNGQQVADTLHNDLEYENIIMTAVKGAAGQVISGGFSSRIQKGVRTTKSVKRIGCSNVKTMIEQDQLILNDAELIEEFSRFIMKKASYQAEEGAHDDLVMCCVLFAWSTNQTFFKEAMESDFRKHLLSKREQMVSDDILPFGFIETGHDTVEILDNTSDYDFFGDYDGF